MSAPHYSPNARAAGVFHFIEVFRRGDPPPLTKAEQLLSEFAQKKLRKTVDLAPIIRK